MQKTLKIWKASEMSKTRLALRPAGESDGDVIMSWLGNPDHSSGYFGTDENPKKWLSVLADMAPPSHLVITYIGCTISNENPVVMVNFKPNYPFPWIWDGDVIIAPEESGNGYGYEAFGLGLGRLITENEVHKVSGPIAANNHSSIRTVEKLGFVREAVLEGHLLNTDGSTLDAYIYSLFPKTWVNPFD